MDSAAFRSFSVIEKYVVRTTENVSEGEYEKELRSTCYGFPGFFLIWMKPLLTINSFEYWSYWYLSDKLPWVIYYLVYMILNSGCCIAA